MSRIEIELYADRLSRHAERLRDDLEGARMRLAWLRLEQDARMELGARDTAVLEALGVMSGTDEQAERRLIDRGCASSRLWSATRRLSSATWTRWVREHGMECDGVEPRQGSDPHLEPQPTRRPQIARASTSASRLSRNRRSESERTNCSALRYESRASGPRS